MSANRARFGPSARNSRRTGSGAVLACGAAGSAALPGRLAPPPVVPARPLSRMTRAARLRDVRSPERPSSAKTFGAPWVPRPAAYISEIAAAGSASRRPCALGGRFLHARWPRLVTWRAARIPDMLQAPSSSGMKADFAPSAREPTAARRRRGRSPVKVPRPPSSAVRSRASARGGPPPSGRGCPLPAPARRRPSRPGPAGSPGRRRARGRSPRRHRPAPCAASPPAA